MHKILIIDDDSSMRSVLSDLVRSGGYEAFSTGNGNIALKEISTHAPDLILLDIRLPGTNGMTLLEKIKEIDRDLLIIMITGHGDIKDAVRAIKLGAFDYITKPFENEEIIATIRNALQTRLQPHHPRHVALSMREKEVLNWLKKGKSSWDISTILNISESTVNYHITNIMQKLNAVSRTQAVAVAIERGLISSD
jgi:DNA-binding NarL/FixJ family response regulator